MASIAVEPVIAAITAAITAAVEKGTEAAVVAAISAAVTEVVEAAVTSAISAAIAAGVVSSVTGAITAATTKAVEAALQTGLDKAVKDVIGSRGVNDLSKAMTAIPSDVVVDQLVKAALGAINPHLWVFKDPAFFRLAKMVRILRAIENDEEPEDDDDGDCDEEKCRFFEGTEVEDNAEDFLFFSVYGNEDCEDGDEVFSMSAQWKNLKSLVNDPIGGHYISQLFQELFESFVEDEEEGEPDEALLAVGGRKPPKKGKKKKLIRAKYGRLVFFGNKTVYNIAGSSVDKRRRNWKKAYFVHGYGKCGKCYIGSEDPVCGHTNPTQGNIVGGHMWNPKLKKKDKSLYYYILPICKRHNKRVVYDKPRPDGTGWLKTLSKSMAMKITSTSKVPGWKSMVKKLSGKKKTMLMTEVGSTDDECTEITQPQSLTDWIMEEVHKIALEFSAGPIEIVFQEVAEAVLGKLNGIIKYAGNDAEHWAKKEGDDIMLQSLIPFYGIYQAIKRLSSLKSDAIHRFHSKAQSALAGYKNECLASEEQGRRKQRLIEETEKVIASQKWKERIETFEGTIASKVSSLIDPEES